MSYFQEEFCPQLSSCSWLVRCHLWCCLHRSEDSRFFQRCTMWRRLVWGLELERRKTWNQMKMKEKQVDFSSLSYNCCTYRWPWWRWNLWSCRWSLRRRGRCVPMSHCRWSDVQLTCSTWSSLKMWQKCVIFRHLSPLRSSFTLQDILLDFTRSLNSGLITAESTFKLAITRNAVSKPIHRNVISMLPLNGPDWAVHRTWRQFHSGAQFPVGIRFNCW